MPSPETVSETSCGAPFYGRADDYEDSRAMDVMRQLIVAVLALACVSCSPSAPTARLNDNFVLAPGESTQVSGADLSIRFVGVQGDSRCPADAVCILGGDAIVRIEVMASAGSTTVYDLH